MISHEYKAISLREIGPAGLADNPQRIVAYYRAHIATDPHFRPDQEQVHVIHLSVRKHIRGHHLVSLGLLDQTNVHAREVFRTAILANAHSVVLVHNHPSGDPTPSEADIRITREMHRAGQLLKMELMDHLVIGTPGVRSPECPGTCSIRELGYLYN